MDRTFEPTEHIVNVLNLELVDMYDDSGNRLPKIRGVGGSAGRTKTGLALGVDRIVMQPGSGFPLHTHEGDHLLVILAGAGSIHIDGVDYPLVEGDSIYVPAEYPHGVGGPTNGRPFELLAFGIPHHPIDSTSRMRVVEGLLAGRTTDGQWATDPAGRD
jgi:quercetin dioxygenase-like cupin family protein